jgi:hypothetical protein
MLIPGPMNTLWLASSCQPELRADGKGRVTPPKHPGWQRLFYLILFYFFGGTLHLLTRCCTIYTILPLLFALLVFEIGSRFYAWASLYYDPPICTSLCSWDDRYMPPCPAIG